MAKLRKMAQANKEREEYRKELKKHCYVILKNKAKIWRGNFDIGWLSNRLRCNGKIMKLDIPQSSKKYGLRGTLIFIEAE